MEELAGVRCQRTLVALVAPQRIIVTAHIKKWITAQISGLADLENTDGLTDAHTHTHTVGEVLHHPSYIPPSTLPLCVHSPPSGLPICFSALRYSDLLICTEV